MRSLSNEILNFFLSKVPSEHFGSCQNCMRSVNLVVEIQFKLMNVRALRTGGRYLKTFSMSLLFLHFFRIATVRRF